MSGTGAGKSAEEPEIARLREELAEANRRLVEEYRMAAVGRLTASIVHEINTPIGSIFSNNEVLVRSLAMVRRLLEDPRPESLAKAGKLIATCESLAGVDKIACERIASVVRGLKTFARAEPAEFQKADLNENFRNTLKLAQAEFRRRITVHTDFGELPEVECYPQKLNQVFLNLLVNAAQAIEREGEITVRTALEGNRVHILVADTGRGIPPEQQPKIFQFGFTTKPVGVGTGLGLSISREIVVGRHGGTLDFETVPGCGTTFHIRIPVRQPRTPAG